MLRRTLILLTASSLALAACGSDGGSDASSADPKADRAAAKSAISGFEADLKAEGFEVDAEADDDSQDDLEFTSAECKEIGKAFGDDDLPGQTGEKESRSFTRGEYDGAGGVQESVQGEAAFVGTPSDLDPVFDVLEDERLEGCVQEAIEHEFSKSSDEEEVRVTSVEVEVQDVPDVGDEAGLIHISAALEASGLQVPVVIDVGMSRQDRAATTVVVTTIGSESPKTKVPHLLDRLLEDLAPAA